MIARARSVRTPRWRHVRAGPWHVASRRWRPARPTARRPAVLVHGLVVSSAYHAPLAERLAEHRPVHALDLPGFGRSTAPKPDHALDTRALAQALIDWCDRSGLSEVALIANSYGCQVVAEAVLRRPDLAAARRRRGVVGHRVG